MTTPEERLKLKEARREANKLAHANGEKTRKPIGTPLGNKQRIQMFKEQLLSEAVGDSIIRKVIDIARNDDHPGQMAAVKMCLDRLLPTSLFEEKKDGARTAIQITIGRVGEEKNITIDQDDNG